MLELKQVSVAIDQRTIVDNVSLSIETGEFGCLLGPSGGGKSTLLQCIAGFHPAQTGTVRLNGKIIESRTYRHPLEQRGIGMMFQDYALFPHLTVRANIGFGIRQTSADIYQERLKKLLALTKLSLYANRYPHELSGGQQQRVALARALAPEPKLLLLDEPFSNLDSELKPKLAQELREILDGTNTTTLMITHDQNEALSISDKLGVMLEGHVLQWGQTYDLYHRPASRQIATFVGMGTMLRGTVTKDKRIKTVLGKLRVDNPDALSQILEVDVLIRPDDIIHDDHSDFQAVIEKKQFRGAEFLYVLRLMNGERVPCFAPSHHNHQIGEYIGIRIDLEHVVFFC